MTTHHARVSATRAGGSVGLAAVDWWAGLAESAGLFGLAALAVLAASV